MLVDDWFTYASNKQSLFSPGFPQNEAWSPVLHGNYCPNVMEYLENKKWPHFFRNEQSQVQKCKDTFKKEIAQVIHRAKC